MARGRRPQKQKAPHERGLPFYVRTDPLAVLAALLTTVLAATLLTALTGLRVLLLLLTGLLRLPALLLLAALLVLLLVGVLILAHDTLQFWRSLPELEITLSARIWFRSPARN